MKQWIEETWASSGQSARSGSGVRILPRYLHPTTTDGLQLNITSHFFTQPLFEINTSEARKMEVSSNTVSTNLQEFHIFNKLPLDIRVLIWEHTFPRRVISLSLSPYDDSLGEDTTANDFRPTVPGDNADPQGLFAVQSQIVGPGGKMINNGLPLPSFVCPAKLGRVLALSACRESRDFAMRVGYRAWTLPVGYGFVNRQIIWNPLYDTIFLDEKHSETLKGQPLFVLTEKFKNTFPSQARELRSLAVYTSQWNQKEPKQEAMVEKWVEFRRLQKIIAVLDPEYETARVEQVRMIDMENELLALGQNEGTLNVQDDENESTKNEPKGVLFPDDLEKDLRLGKTAQKKWSTWIVPTVTLCDRDRLLQGITDNLEMRLHCDPCNDLVDYMRKEQEYRRSRPRRSYD
ncbi:hypothetical protein DL98DRAFT_604940 [Cadophora sp. DSE1049]|nr:hypothetical protein DL98DRAFT_604940 [Cadophora sp. DSE1049]